MCVGRGRGCIISLWFYWAKEGTSTNREVSGMRLQLAVSLRFFVGRDRSEHTIAMRSAGRSQVLAGIFVFGCIREGRDG
jgi:hypothetical protein